jgi:hypothetical protein
LLDFGIFSGSIVFWFLRFLHKKGDAMKEVRAVDELDNRAIIDAATALEERLKSLRDFQGRGDEDLVLGLVKTIRDKATAIRDRWQE